MYAVNLFGYRTARPPNLWTVADPVGPYNHCFVSLACLRTSMVIAAWGNHGRRFQIDPIVANSLSASNVYCLGLTTLGQPRHPLYLRSTIDPRPFDVTSLYGSKN